MTVNVALYKPAYQQHPWIPGDETYDVSNAVDGLKSDLRGTGGQCAVSDVRQTGILWVNLTSIHNIHHITIYMTYNDQWSIFPIITSFPIDCHINIWLAVFSRIKLIICLIWFLMKHVYNNIKLLNSVTLSIISSIRLLVAGIKVEGTRY